MRALSLFVVLALLPAGSAGAEKGHAVGPTCEGSLQAKIDAASPGSEVVLEDGCVYRESVTVDKPLAIRGAGEGEIRGSDVWGDWGRDGPLWRSDRRVPDLSVPPNYRCEGASRRCQWPEQVFVDGRSLAQVASDPRAGQFALDGDRRVVLADDPAGRVVEVTVRERWMLGAAADVSVLGTTMKHAAGDGLWNGGYPGWRIEGNDLSWAHTKNLSLTLGDSLVAEDNNLHDAGQMGMNSNDAEIRIAGNRIHHNGTEGFDPGWAAGGMKIAQPRAAWILDNEVHHNGDIGIWTDVVSEEQAVVEIAHNRVHHQAEQGIRVEVTKNFDVHDNVLWENGWGKGDSYNGSGITVAGSHDGAVDDNVLAWNASGVVVVQQDREGPEEHPYNYVKNVRLNRNRIVQDEPPGSLNHAAVVWNEGYGATARGFPSPYDAAANNGGAEGRYWFDGPEGGTPRFKWKDRLEDLDAFNATPAEKNGRYLTDAGKDSLLEANSLPVAPEDRSSNPVTLFDRLRGLLCRLSLC